MTEEYAKEYWARADKLLGKKKWIDVCKDTGINNGTLKQLRTDNKVPNTESSIKLANYFNVSLDYLLTGNTGDSLTPLEQQLIANYRQSTNLAKATAEYLLKMSANYPQEGDFLNPQAVDNKSVASKEK